MPQCMQAEDSKATSMGAEELVDMLRDAHNQKDEAQSGVVDDQARALPPACSGSPLEPVTV